MLLDFELLNSKPTRLIWFDPADIFTMEEAEKSGPAGYRALRIALKGAARDILVNNYAGETAKRIVGARNKQLVLTETRTDDEHRPHPIRETLERTDRANR